MRKLLYHLICRTSQNVCFANVSYKSLNTIFSKLSVIKSCFPEHIWGYRKDCQLIRFLFTFLYLISLSPSMDSLYEPSGIKISMRSISLLSSLSFTVVNSNILSIKIQNVFLKGHRIYCILKWFYALLFFMYMSLPPIRLEVPG